MSKITSDFPTPARFDHWVGIFSLLNIGDSVFVLNEHGRVAAYQYGKRHQKRFTVRKELDGYRVWRTS